MDDLLCIYYPIYPSHMDVSKFGAGGTLARSVGDANAAAQDAALDALQAYVMVTDDNGASR